MYLKTISILSILLFIQTGFAQNMAIRSADKKAAEARAAAEQKDAETFNKATSGWSSVDHNRKVERFNKSITDREEEINQLNASIRAGEKKIVDINSGRLSSWIGVPQVQAGIKVNKAKIKEIQAKIDADKVEMAKHSKAITNLSNLNPQSLEIGMARLDAKHLLLDFKQVQALLDNASMKKDQLYVQLDQTLVGQYAKYTADLAVKNFKENGLCEAVNKCSGVTSAKADIGKIKTEIKSFEQWKNEMLEQMKSKPQNTEAGAN